VFFGSAVRISMRVHLEATSRLVRFRSNDGDGALHRAGRTGYFQRHRNEEELVNPVTCKLFEVDELKQRYAALEQ
jgi:hypothetical protein